MPQPASAGKRRVCRLHNVSITRVDFRGPERTPANNEAVGKPLTHKHLGFLTVGSRVRLDASPVGRV